jgi:RNA polymerase sigma-70 factor (ECF subfamily)
MKKDKSNLDPDMKQTERGERFMSLYTAVQRRLYHYVISLVPDENTVDDIIQETVSFMWKKFDEFEPGTDFIAWAFSIAKYRIFDHIKQQKKEKKSFSSETIRTIQEVFEARSDKDEDHRMEALRNCLKKLSYQDQQLLVMRYEVDATLKSISQRIEQSINTIYNRLYRIRIALMNCVTRTINQKTT